jgi:hypothetical protein
VPWYQTELPGTAGTGANARIPSVAAVARPHRGQQPVRTCLARLLVAVGLSSFPGGGYAWVPNRAGIRRRQGDGGFCRRGPETGCTLGAAVGWMSSPRRAVRGRPVPRIRSAFKPDLARGFQTVGESKSGAGVLERMPARQSGSPPWPCNSCACLAVALCFRRPETRPQIGGRPTHNGRSLLC